MKKLLLISIFIVGIVFVTGCLDVGSVDNNPKTSSESKSSGALLNPTKLLTGYLSSDYKTYALSEMDSYEPRVVIDEFKGVQGGTNYEGDIPEGKKRVATSFKLTNSDTNTYMMISIQESDSNSKFKQAFSDITNKYSNESAFKMETNIVGDYSILISGTQERGKFVAILFSNKNYLVTILSNADSKTDPMKVAEEINSKLN